MFPSVKSPVLAQSTRYLIKLRVLGIAVAVTTLVPFFLCLILILILFTCSWGTFVASEVFKRPHIYPSAPAHQLPRATVGECFRILHNELAAAGLASQQCNWETDIALCCLTTTPIHCCSSQANRIIYTEATKRHRQTGQTGHVRAFGMRYKAVFYNTRAFLPLPSSSPIFLYGAYCQVQLKRDFPSKQGIAILQQNKQNRQKQKSHTWRVK